MSIHIAAKPGDIAKTVLLPGDPLRAKYVAEQFLEDAVCYNEVRGMLGYTGTYRGKRVSVQGTGMGIPSISIYVNELIAEYGVKNLMRVGTCGSIQPTLGLKDVILAVTASTDSQVNKLRFHGADYAPAASFVLLKKAYDLAAEKQIAVKVGVCGLAARCVGLPGSAHATCQEGPIIEAATGKMCGVDAYGAQGQQHSRCHQNNASKLAKPRV